MPKLKPSVIALVCIILTLSLLGCTEKKTLILNDTNTEFSNYIDFNTSDGFPQQEGRLQWNANDGTLEFGLPGGNVNLQIGQENLVKSRNVSGVDINNGNVVYISGSTGDYPQITLADADDISSSHKVIGVATENISNTHYGYVTTFGFVRDINTLPFPAGADLYLSQTAGKFTTLIPSPPAHSVAVGHVIRSHQTEGIIYVTIRGGSDLNGLDDVNASLPVSGNFLVRSNTGVWQATNTFTGDVNFDGNVLFNDTYWDDIRVPLLSTRVGVLNPPTLAAFDGNVYVYQFSNAVVANEEDVSLSVQVPHDYKLDSNIEGHVHWSPVDNVDCNVVFRLECVKGDIFGTFAAFPASEVIGITGSNNTKKHMLKSFGFLGGFSNVSGIMHCTFTRKSSYGEDTCTAAVWVHEIDFHYEKDSIGSRGITTK